MPDLLSQAAPPFEPQVEPAADKAVLLVGFSRAQFGILQPLVEADCTLLLARRASEVPDLQSRHRVAVLCLGPEIAPNRGCELLTEAQCAGDTQPAICLILAAGSAPEMFQAAVDSEQLFFLSRTPPAPDAQAILIDRALRTYETQNSSADKTSTLPSTKRLREPAVVEILSRLALQQEPGDLAELAARAAREVVGAERGYCLLYDRDDETLWVPDPSSGGERRHSAAIGLAGFFLRTRLEVRLFRTVEKALYDR